LVLAAQFNQNSLQVTLEGIMLPLMAIYQQTTQLWDTSNICL